MRTRLTLWPGQKGTKKLLAEYGEQLVCVRYRYDVARQRRYKTVELVVEESVWLPEPELIVGVRVALGEQGLRRQVKAAGGVWNKERQVWELAVGQVVALGLEERIVAENDQAVVPIRGENGFSSKATRNTVSFSTLVNFAYLPKSKGVETGWSTDWLFLFLLEGQTYEDFGPEAAAVLLMASLSRLESTGLTKNSSALANRA